ncbi:hypothetical protein MVEN_00022200 [Mycena venus]|uniref:Uncharacterized protein n=1 Tax=Mycena venus TaxID=2733690 RepID=A0A8H6Z6I7_9AGAR|nr:hypothetical protein MVEN_00022200 [Mycena venus]
MWKPTCSSPPNNGLLCHSTLSASTTSWDNLSLLGVLAGRTNSFPPELCLYYRNYLNFRATLAINPVTLRRIDFMISSIWLCAPFVTFEPSLTIMARRAPVRPFVSSLIRVLAYMCSEDVWIRSGIPFVRPRIAPLDRELDGIATMIACRVVRGSEHAPEDAMDIAAPSKSSRSLYDALVIDSEAGSSASSEPPSVDVTIDGHLLPGCGRHYSTILPFLCVSDSDNVLDLMASVACQRFVWGITEPVVGFLLSGTSVVAKLVISWVDPATRIVHFARPAHHAKCDGRSKLGIFDFADSASTLRFSQLILSLSSRFAIIAEHAAVSCKNNRLNWRLDTPELAALGTWRERVAQWVRDVDIALSGGKSSPPPLPCPPTERSGTTSEDYMAPRSKEKASSVDASHPSENIGKASSDARSEGQGSLNVSVALPYKASSSFARGTVQGFDKTGKADPLTWTIDRAVQLAGLFPYETKLPNLTPDQINELEEVNEKCSAYNQMCGFRWSTSWNKDNPPAVDAGLSSLRTLLLEQGEELSQSSSAPNQPPQSLDAEHERCVADRMSIVLSASAGAYTIHAQRNGVQVYEAESRHDWDHLLYHFYARSDEETSPYVLLERTIHYPRNHLADTLSNNHFFVSINETELSFTREGTPKFDVSRQLLLPHVVVEYKKPSDTAGKALNRGRMYLVSIVSFYVALGIEDRPFFCLVTAGKVGVLLMAWKSSKQKKTYLMERNVMKFDISSPVQAFHFATILLRLRDDQEELKELAKAKLACKSFDWEKFKCWRKASQEVELALAGAAAASTQAAK